VNWTYGTLVAIFVLLSILQILFDYLLTHVFKDARTTGHKKLRMTLLCVTLSVFVASQIAVLVEGYRQSESAKTERAELNSQIAQLKEQVAASNIDSRNEFRHELQTLRTDFATNQSRDIGARIAVLNTEASKTVEKRAELLKQQELIAIEPISLRSLRKERTNRLAIQETELRQSEVLRLKAEIEEQEAEKERQRIEEQSRKDRESAEQKSKEEIAAREKLINEQSVAVFDQVIGSLYFILTSIGKETDNVVSSDFPKNPPTAQYSSLFSDGKITKGTNQLLLGTNLTWRFEISSSPPRLLAPKEPKSPVRFLPAKLNILSLGKDGVSSFSISPTDSTASPRYNLAIEINQVNLALHLPNQPADNRAHPSTNYVKGIEQALRALVGAQDNQFRLNSAVSH